MSFNHILTVAIAIAMIINQWSIAIYNKAVKADPSTPSTSKVATKASNSRYWWLGVDFGILIAALAGIWYIVAPDPFTDTPRIHVVFIAFLAAIFMSTTRNITARLQRL